jgi:mannose-6-phosphate isomerase-like protein (cupin superfamily)
MGMSGIRKSNRSRPKKVNLSQKFGLFQDYWSPKIVGKLNDSYVKLVKLKGEFVWHHHLEEDELFLVTKGQLTIKLRGTDVALRKGEFLVVPRGVEHKPVAVREAHVVLIERKTTRNTGEVRSERTVENLERI